MSGAVVHWKRKPFDVYVGRPGPWGNPFEIGRDGTREEVIAKYEQWLMGKPDLLAQLPTLRGKVLGCWCAPHACHGDVLLRLANGGDAPQTGSLFESKPQTESADAYCNVPPPGWTCTRKKGHEGPCAAWPSSQGLPDDAVAWLRFKHSSTSERPSWLTVCAPHDKGAFAVYRHAAQTESAEPWALADELAEALEEICDGIEDAGGTDGNGDVFDWSRADAILKRYQAAKGGGR